MAPGINGMVSFPTLSEIGTVGLVQSLKYHVPTSCMLRPCATKTLSKAKIASGNSSSSSSRNVEKINGKKVNGVHVIEMPPKGGIINDNNNNNSGNRTSSNLEDDPIRPYLLGRFYEDGYIFRQTFVIRSYEIGPDKTATMETIMNLLQETALNQVSSSGVGGDGFGATREMGIRKLIWVVTRIHVQIEKYSSWGDFVEIDTWVDAAGKNGMRRDWVIRDCKTQKIITRATSTWVTMNRETRKLSKIPDEVKCEIQPFYLNREAIKEEDTDREKIEKLNSKTAERVRSGLAPRWSDMDANQHVNNVKYIGWLLESMPIGVLQDYSLTSMTLEYRRECRLSNVLDSLTSIKPKMDGESMNHSTTGMEGLECTHLLRMQADNAEIIRARSIWKSKERPTN
ncbi:esterase [Lithospermum erythrorhizon]|uniref:Acyl-[acyl-carrier-protein] hydrolase n=1 Tax=Lithospermum erythrorhizon TaxID=34254 RepID=A0AAV3NYC5_LITER